MAGARLELGASQDFPVDWKAFVEIFAGHEYSGAPFAGAYVLDIGAHKGYFAAYALARGASVVRSFEPDSVNYEVLERTAEPLRPRWTARDVAVGAASGQAVLRLDRASWAHSLLEVEHPVGERLVQVITLEEALAELPRGDSTTVVKIDAEGSECDILARPESLELVDVLLVEWHTSAPCTLEELTHTIESAGLAARRNITGARLFERR